MRIEVQFVWNGDRAPSAVTGVEGDVTTVLLPSPGDLVEHRDFQGEPMMARVTSRSFRYMLSQSENADGEVAVILWLDRVNTGPASGGHH